MNPYEAQIVRLALDILDAQLKIKGAEMTSPELVSQFLRLQLELEEQEVFAVLFLDTRHRLIEFRRMFFGTIDGASVYPREVVKVALQLNAAAAILVHNHPSGISEPSQADRHLTNRLRDSLALVDVRVLDHMVVGQREITSFAERGWI
jgi:DNA repair protein RadC